MNKIFFGICLLAFSLSMATEQKVIYGQSSTPVTGENNRSQLVAEAAADAQKQADEICAAEKKKAKITSIDFGSYATLRETNKMGLALNVQYMVECK